VPGERRKPPPKRERPRDELGRPLPWGSENRLQMEDFDALPVAENHRLGIEHFNARRFFPAHEAWETAWKQSRGTPDEEFYKGLSQLGAGYVHFSRGNLHGTHTLIRRATSRLRRYAPVHGRIDLAALVEQVEEQAATVERSAASGEGMPPLDPPRIAAGTIDP